MPILYKCLKSRDNKFYNGLLYTTREVDKGTNNRFNTRVLEKNEYLESGIIQTYRHVFEAVHLDPVFAVHTGMTPVHGDMFIQVLLRDGSRKQEYAKNIPWSSKVKGKDVVAYRIISLHNPMAINDRITKLEKENRELRAALEEYEEYEKQNEFPQLGDGFYCINAKGEVMIGTWGTLGGIEYDVQQFTGVYETREEAELVAEAIREFVKEHNE